MTQPANLGPVREPLDPGPLREWVAQRLEANGDDVDRLASDLGIGMRRLHRWRNEAVMLERADVAEALHHADSALWEVYDDEIELEPDGHCATCKETVTPIKGVCPWCDTAVTAAPARKRGGGKPKGKYRRMTDDQIRAAHALYEREGLSFNQLGALLWEKFGFSSAKSCGNSLCGYFKDLCLPARDRIDATVKASLKHGRKRRNLGLEGERAYRRWLAEQRGWKSQQGPGQDRCAGTKRQPPRKGEPCDRPSLIDSDYCAAHDPRRELARQAHLAGVRRRQQPRDMLPMEPFARWVDALKVEVGGSLAVLAERLDCSTATAHNIVRRLRSAPDGGRRPWTEIDRARVARYLEAADGPDVDDLYSPSLERAA